MNSLTDNSPVGGTFSPGHPPDKPDFWEVVYAGGANVWSSTDRNAQVIAFKPQGVLTRARKEGSWLALADQPGYILISRNGRTLMRPTGSAPDATEAIMVCPIRFAVQDAKLIAVDEARQVTKDITCLGWQP